MQHVPVCLTLRIARGLIGMTQRELAAAAGVSIATISRIERGADRGVRAEALEAVAEVLRRQGVAFDDPADLVGGQAREARGNWRVGGIPTTDDLRGLLRQEIVPRTWLVQRLTVADARAGRVVSEPLKGRPSIPRNAPLWRDFLNTGQAGDELWEFCTPPETWTRGCGRGGFAWVEPGGEAVTTLTLVDSTGVPGGRGTPDES